MTDERVDALLKDLDAALSVEPSPSVAARVRTRIDEPSRWQLIGWRLAAVTGIALAVVTYAVWPHVEPARTDEPRLARTTPSSPASANSPTPSLQRPIHDADAVSRQARAARRVPTPGSGTRVAKPWEPEVIVSPQMRLAFEQLEAAGRSGRLSAEPRSQAVAEPTLISPTAIEIRALEIDLVTLDAPVAGTGPESGGQRNEESRPMWPNRPLSRTRSTS